MRTKFYHPGEEAFSPDMLMTKGPGTVSRTRCGFTLIELLVVISILAILMVLAFVGMGHLRASAAQTECTARLRALGSAISTYAADNDNRLPGFGVNTRSRWLHQVAPYLGHESDHVFQGMPVCLEAYNFEEFSTPAKTRWRDPVASTTRPSGIYGYNPLLFGETTGMRGVSAARISRPASTVLLVTKVSGDPSVRVSGPYPDVPSGAAAVHRRDGRPADGPDGPANYLFVDGHVETLREWVGEDGFEFLDP